MASGLLLRLLGVAAFGAAPIAALETTTPDISTGDAIASPTDGGFQNTGGNLQLGTGKTDSKVVIGDPAAAPAAPGALAVVPKIPKNPAADAIARARQIVDDAKSRAQAQIDAARANAERAVAEAKQTSADAQAHGQEQANSARANAAVASQP